MCKSVWILTREINQYDQDGEYFVSVYAIKPTDQQLQYDGVPSNRRSHVLSGGGRVGDEYEWFHLNEIVLELL